MIIKKKFNNNVVMVSDDHGQELVLIGKGLAFSSRPGDVVAQQNIEKVFRLDSSNLNDNLGNLLSNVPKEQYQLCDRIIQEAHSVLSKELSDYLYLSLMDHISFAIVRAKQGLLIRNPLTWEVKKIYPKEYEIGTKSLDWIEEETGLRLPTDEAASIALHIVNAQQGKQELQEVVKNLDILQDILGIVKYHFGINFDENSLNFERFMVHLKFFILRVTTYKQLDHAENHLFQSVISQWPQAYDCVSRIARYIASSEGIEINEDEQFYLMVHIHRLTDRK